jgi:polysaccharide export outer membrane protein
VCVVQEEYNVKTRVLRLSAAVVAVFLLAAPAFADNVYTSQSVAEVPAVEGVAASAGATVSDPATNVPADPNYRIVAEDALRLDVWGESQLSAMQFQVTPGGTINVPYLGEIEVAGLTQTEIAEKIARMLAEQDIVYDAKVQITLISMHKPQVRVLGAVTRPGSWDFKDGDTVFDAIGFAGSYREDAMLESATLTHKDADHQIPVDIKKLLAGDMSQNHTLTNGDVIYIPHEEYNNKIYVLGQVNRPGQYSLKDNTTMLAAISLAGGATEKGSIRDTVLMRGDPAKPERIKANFGKLFDTGDMSQDLVLNPGDVVVVPDSKKFDWQKVASVVSTMVNLSYLRRVGF